MRPFQNLINQIKSDLACTDEIIKVITTFYKKSNLTGYVETFESLHVKIDLLTDTYKSVYENFDEYQSLSFDSERSKKSLIPITGQ